MLCAYFNNFFSHQSVHSFCLSCSIMLQNSELLTLTYGAIVAQIIRDYEDPKEVNAQLEQM